ncbi:MAG: hypothetical protein IKR65_01940 [Selenomonadaceae bacterium]|nr:hypothetical protein [Selenomonadaceae bacterium]
MSRRSVRSKKLIRPVCSTAIRRMILRQTDGETGEHQLVAAVIEQALDDLAENAHRFGAYQFLHGRGAKMFELAGLDPAAVSKIAEQYDKELQRINHEQNENC